MMEMNIDMHSAMGTTKCCRVTMIADIYQRRNKENEMVERFTEWTELRLPDMLITFGDETLYSAVGFVFDPECFPDNRIRMYYVNIGAWHGSTFNCDFDYGDKNTFSDFFNTYKDEMTQMLRDRNSITFGAFNDIMLFAAEKLNLQPIQEGN